MTFLGVDLDMEKNKAADKTERSVALKSSRVDILVIPTNEELVIALDTMKIVHEM
jgi:acetate kinase